MREIHWHKEAEWAYVLNGRVRITAVDENGWNFVDDLGVGDLWYFPSGIPHALQGLEDCEFLLVFDDGHFSENSTFSMTDWFAHTPKDVLSANFGVSERAFDGIPSGERYIYQGKVPPKPLPTQEVSDPDTGATRERLSHRMLEQEPIPEARSASDGDDQEKRGGGCEPEPADLDEPHDHDLTECRVVARSVDDDEPRHADGRRRREHGGQERSAARVGGRDRQPE